MKVKVSQPIGAIMFSLMLLLTVPNLEASQEVKSLTAVAQGQGTLTVGTEVFKVGSVVVKLNEDGTSEITIVSDIQVLVTCTWSRPEDLSKGIDLKITGGTNAGSIQGSGKLFLRPDAKAIASLSMEGMNSAVKRKIQLEFVADKT